MINKVMAENVPHFKRKNKIFEPLILRAYPETFIEAFLYMEIPHE